MDEKFNLCDFYVIKEYCPTQPGTYQMKFSAPIPMLFWPVRDRQLQCYYYYYIS